MEVGQFGIGVGIFLEQYNHLANALNQGCLDGRCECIARGNAALPIWVCKTHFDQFMVGQGPGGFVDYPFGQTFVTQLYDRVQVMGDPLQLFIAFFDIQLRTFMRAKRRGILLICAR